MVSEKLGLYEACPRCPPPGPVSTLSPTREAAWGLGRKWSLWLEQLRPSGVQPATGPSRLELG